MMMGVGFGFPEMLINRKDVLLYSYLVCAVFKTIYHERVLEFSKCFFFIYAGEEKFLLDLLWVPAWV